MLAIHAAQIIENLELISTVDLLSVIDNNIFNSIIKSIYKQKYVSTHLNQTHQILWSLNTFKSEETNTFQYLVQTNLNIFHLDDSIDRDLSESQLNFTYRLMENKLQNYVSMEFIKSQYHASIPLRKLQYPEPFVASMSFVYTDIGFIHILQYNFWLWFLFIWMIAFFFLTFIIVVRWSTIRVKPRRETRGVSRSKCGDFITACVPITWAISIIVTESTDANDYFDGFGASEITVGIRAYQWGWEYYYPKKIDLNYNLSSSYSTYVGKSLKYTTSTEKNRSTNNLWKFYQNKSLDATLTPAHLLLLPLDNKKLLNFLNFTTIGFDSLKESTAFKKIKTISKTFNSNLVTTPTLLNLKYKKLNETYLNDNSFLLSTNYGLVRQHNFLNLKSNLNKNKPLLDNESFNRFLLNSYNPLQQELKGFNFFNNLITIQTNYKTSQIPSFLSLMYFSNFSDNLLNQFQFLSLYPTTLLTLNNNSDIKFLLYPFRKYFNLNFKNNSLYNTSYLINSFSDLNSLTKHFLSEKFLNHNTSNKLLTLSSSNQNVSSSEQTISQYTNLSVNKTNYNLNSTNSTPFNMKNDLLLNNLYYNMKSNWINVNLFYKLVSNKLNLTSPYAPIFNSNILSQVQNYDLSFKIKDFLRVKNKQNTLLNHNYLLNKTNSVNILKGKRDNAPEFLNTAYWNTFWSNTSPTIRYDSIIKSISSDHLNYLPSFTSYYDYDFRNLQAYELLEDLVWENSYSSYNHYEYLNTLQNNNKGLEDDIKTLSREPHFFDNNLTLDKKIKSLILPTKKDLSLTGSFYVNSFYLDELLSASDLTQENDFKLPPFSSNIFLLEESYEHWNEVRNTYSKSLLTYSLQNLTSVKPQSYLNVFNLFKADFEDFSWLNEIEDAKFLDLNLEKKSTILPLNFTNTNDENLKLSRLSNPLTLRLTTKNSIVNFNALQKVFRARLEDGRSNVSLTQFSELFSTQPFLNSERVPYENLLGKTRNNFFNNNFFNNNTINIFNLFYNSNSSLNFQFFDFPFLLSNKSDMSRYMWFDWYSQWGFFEVGPSSVSRYTTIGVPYIKKSFSYNIETGETISESETYFSRISRSRKNYIPNWNYTPYLYMRSAHWYNHNLNSYSSTKLLDYTVLRTFFNLLTFYDKNHFFYYSLSSLFTPTNSGISTYTNSFWRPFSSIQSYYHTLATLADFLTKREYIYRQYLELNNLSIHLPEDLTATPKNSLLEEVRASFSFNEPTTLLSESSREVYYNSLNFFKFLLVKDWLIHLKTTPFNLIWLNDYFFFYLFDIRNNFKNANNLEFYKNPYRPMKKGVSNMLRLHATGAIAMPVEVRLQILASSRDVIHSWSVPSAGVKIDCVPGYTSHKIMIFLMEGIYWGQCMEICGRYHHWMPIMVYFMRRDLFFLWCTHFIFTTNMTKEWEINDRPYINYIKSVTQSSSNWINEVSK